jgi:hypothetical protein
MSQEFEGKPWLAGASPTMRSGWEKDVLAAVATPWLEDYPVSTLLVKHRQQGG